MAGTGLPALQLRLMMTAEETCWCCSPARGRRGRSKTAANSELGDEAPRTRLGSSGLVALQRTWPHGRAGSPRSGARGKQPAGSRRWARKGEQVAGDGEHLRLSKALQQRAWLGGGPRREDPREAGSGATTMVLDSYWCSSDEESWRRGRPDLGAGAGVEQRRGWLRRTGRRRRARLVAVGHEATEARAPGHGDGRDMRGSSVRVRYLWVAARGEKKNGSGKIAGIKFKQFEFNSNGFELGLGKRKVQKMLRLLMELRKVKKGYMTKLETKSCDKKALGFIFQSKQKETHGDQENMEVFWSVGLGASQTVNGNIERSLYTEEHIAALAVEVL
ncbi:hypothetical protein TRIUR3_27634 [Triticum urartu]|uniref:Uncharacterized protein n=1 Tax=Triticum urartu TaxID=4572 RepID=M7ZMS9_TRIUA|nr:hypothetical protein TRIUR3_27634 [Triticum urartu]